MPRVYAGTVGQKGGPLDPAAFWLAADTNTGLPKRLSVTMIAGCVASAGPLSFTTGLRASDGTGGLSGAAVTGLGHGRFTASITRSLTGGRTVNLRLTGAVSKTRASGTMHVTVVAADGSEPCGVTSQPWRSVRRPGRVFGGTMSGAGTVVVTRIGDDDLRFHASVIVSDCDGADPILPSIVVQGAFDVRRGRFQRPVDDDLTAIRTRVSYLITGTLGRQRAHGDFKGHIDGYGDTGATTWSCRFPLHHWSAVTG
jgi:hypothetical protein